MPHPSFLPPSSFWPGRLDWRLRFGLGILAGLLALVLVLHLTRPRVVALKIPASVVLPDAADPAFARTMGLYTGLLVDSGNHVEVLLNGDGTFPSLWHDLQQAEHSITIQSYYSKPGAIADSLSVILRSRAAHGVRVLLLMDAFGSAAMPSSWIETLRRDGVRVALLRPVTWSGMHHAATRSHVRAMIIDGRVAYTGGFGFADYWQGDGDLETAWRETNVRVTGPVVAQLQAAFANGWLEATGELLADPTFVRRDDVARGSSSAGLLLTTAANGRTAAERFLALAIVTARTRIYITNSYFVPDADYRRLLIAAARRGVDVRVLTAGPTTDVRATRYAGRHLYAQLLRAGIRIYEYEAAMMHAKTLSVDGRWATIGSMNFDSRSLAFNDESTLVVLDSRVADEMDAIFDTDVLHSREITLAAFARRSWRERVLEIGANLINALL